MNYITALVLILGIILPALVLSKTVGDSARKVEISVKSVVKDAERKTYRVHLAAEGKEHRLELQKLQPHQLLSHSPVSIIAADVDSEGKLNLDKWSPTTAELQLASNIYVDTESRAALTITQSDSGEHILNGVVNGFSIKHDGANHVGYETKKPKNDFLRVPAAAAAQNLSSNNPAIQPMPMAESDQNIVELLIFCDVDFGNIFGFDRQRMLEYWTIFMWDVNMRYKTLESVKVAFRTVGVVVAASVGAQSFIEEARVNGKVEHGRFLNTWPRFAEENSGSLPKFDMVAIATATEHEWCCGLAYIGAVCNYPTYNIASFNEDGQWTKVSVAAHEMGHNMGGDHDDDPNGACKDNIYNGYIMDGSDEDRRFFFSACSDRDITNTVNSNDRACLRRQDEPNRIDLPIDYDFPLAPSFDAQCKARSNGASYVQSGGNQCKKITCQNQGGGTFTHEPLDDSICDTNSRCFRGNCRQSGEVIRNVGSGLCLRAQNQFSHWAPFELITCPAYASPLDRLVVRNGATGTTFGAPFEQGDKTKETGDKCMWAGESDEDVTIAWSDRCEDYTNPYHGWSLRDVGNGQFSIVHNLSGRCARPESRSEGAILLAVKDCDTNNNDLRWTRAQ